MDSLEHPRTLPDAILDGGLVEKISDWEPAASPVSGCYPGRSTYGVDYLPGAFGSGGVSGQWTHGGDVESVISGAVGSQVRIYKEVSGKYFNICITIISMLKYSCTAYDVSEGHLYA